MTSLAHTILRGLADPGDAVASALERLIEAGSADADRFAALVANESRTLRTKTLRDRKREAPFGLLSDLALLEERIEDERAAKGQPLAQDQYAVGQPLTFHGSAFQQTLDAAVRDLPEDERDAWFLTELRGITDREAAEHLGVSYVTVHRRRKQATIRIREELAA